MTTYKKRTRTRRRRTRRGGKWFNIFNRPLNIFNRPPAPTAITLNNLREKYVTFYLKAYDIALKKYIISEQYKEDLNDYVRIRDTKGLQRDKSKDFILTFISKFKNYSFNELIYKELAEQQKELEQKEHEQKDQTEQKLAEQKLAEQELDASARLRERERQYDETKDGHLDEVELGIGRYGE